MKRKILLIGLLVITFGFVSCSDWFDVSPKSDVKADDLYSTESGFRDVLTGVYALMATENLYGRQMTFGYVDVLAQYYDRISLKSHEYIETVNFQYKEPVDEIAINNIWSTQYKAIVNLNTLLFYIDQNRYVFESENIYKIYKGEALALRAFLHFDMLRLFGPSPIMGEDLKAIPYMDSYTNIAKERSSVKEVLEKVVADLNAARELMKEVDSYGPEYENLKDSYADDRRLKNRYFHLNYYATTALLARVELYAGHTQEALNAAVEIIGEPENEPVQPFELAIESSSEDRLFESEILFTLDIANLENIIDPYFGETALKSGLTNSGTILAFSTTKRDNLFGKESPADDDYRLKNWFATTSSSNSLMSGKLTDSEQMPLIRLSELYYIAAECAGGSRGLDYLNKIRAHRGLVAYTDASKLEENIYKEYCKEFMNEGQMFYYYKRKNLSSMGVYSTKTVVPEEVYALPLPVDEQDYGNKN